MVAVTVVHSALLCRKAALSLPGRSLSARFAKGVEMFSCTMTSLSLSLPKTDTGLGGAVVTEVVETEAVDLSWLVGWRPLMLQGGCCVAFWPDDREDGAGD